MGDRVTFFSQHTRAHFLRDNELSMVGEEGQKGKKAMTRDSALLNNDNELTGK